MSRATNLLMRGFFSTRNQRVASSGDVMLDPPAAVTGFSTNESSPGEVAVDWAPHPMQVAPVDGDNPGKGFYYHVEKSTGSNSSYIDFEWHIWTGTNDGTLPVDTYWYRITPVLKNGPNGFVSGSGTSNA